MAYRYFATGSMFWHLRAMGRYLRGEGRDADIADAGFASQYRRFKWSECAIRIATVSLGIGAGAAVGAWQAL